jgi:hypothetical protein
MKDVSLNFLPKGSGQGSFALCSKKANKYLRLCYRIGHIMLLAFAQRILAAAHESWEDGVG